MRSGEWGSRVTDHDCTMNHENSYLAFLLSLLLAGLLAVVDAGEAKPAAEQSEELSDKPPEMALSAAAQKRVEKFMNLVLDDPRNEFAFEQVYEIYESEKQTWKLLDFFLNAARLRPTDGNLQLLLGKMYIRFRDYYKATEHFEAALRIFERNYYARLKLGQVYLKRDDAEKARENLAEAVKVAVGPGDRVEALFLLAEAFMRDEKVEAASKAWDDILGIQQFDVPTLQRLARVYRAHKLPDNAEKMLKEVLDLAKNDLKLKYETLLSLSELHEARGDRDTAIKELRQAQKLLLPNSARRRDVEDRIRRLHREGDQLQEFFDNLEQRVKERPNDVNLRKEIARLYLSEGKVETAAEHVQEGMAIDSRDVLLLEQAVEANIGLEKVEAATGVLEQLHDISGGAPAYLVDKGEILWEQGKQDDALATWQRIVSVESPSIDRYEALARTCRKHEQQDKAIAAYEKMLSMDPNVQGVRLALAEYLLSLGEKERAAELLAPLAECSVGNPQLRELAEETKQPSHWTLGQFDDGVEGELRFDEKAGHAVLSVKTKGPRHGVKASQKVALLPEILYHVSARVKKLEGDGKVTVGIDTPLTACEVPGKDEWQEVRIPIPADPEPREIEVSLQVDGGPTKVAIEGIRVARPTTAETFLQVAELYAEHDMDSELMALLEEARSRYPEDYRIAKRIGSAFERLKEHQKAIQSFFEAYDHAPNWREKEVLTEKLISLHLAYGTGSHLGRLARMIYKLHEDIGRDPENPDPYVDVARVAAVYRPAVELHHWGTHVTVPGISKIPNVVRRGDHFTMGQVAAIDYYKQALERDPMRIGAYVGMSRCYIFFDEFEKAVMEYKKLAIVNPVGKWKYYFAIGDMFASQGQTPEARAFWDRVAERAFTDATLYFRLAARYYWARQPERAIRMFRKAISIYYYDFRYHLALANVLTEEKQYGQAIAEYREALKLSAETMHTMLVPVQRTMAKAQVQYAHELFARGEYQQALDIYQEIRKYQEDLNKYLEEVVPGFPDTLMQIVRTQAKVAGKRPALSAYQPITKQFPEATCWVADHLEMAADYFASLDAEREFTPSMAIRKGASTRKLPSLQQGFSVRVYPWVTRVCLSPERIYLARRFSEAELDPKTGKVLADSDRRGVVRYFGTDTFRMAGGKLALSEIKSGRALWEVDGSWSYDPQANADVVVGLAKSKLQALDRKTGKLLWEAPTCQEFTVTDRYVTTKRVKRWVARTGGLEEHAHGDTEAIGYIFHVLDARSGKVVFEDQSSGSHYWRVPVVVGDLVVLTDGFSHQVYAHHIASGKLRWIAKFDSFFAAPPLEVDGKIYLYMRRPELKTVIQYVLDPATGDILHETDMGVNSLYARPIAIGQTIFYYDPVKYELIGVDREKGGVVGRRSVREWLPEGSHIRVITLHGMNDSIYIYTQDGLVVRLDVGK